MPEQPTRLMRQADGEWWMAVVVILAVILFRAGVFVFFERAHFDSDQAITGLMGKHLAEGRAFPVFYYGQSHMLGVEAWLAAPLFLLAGTSVAALKLPILAINLVIGWLLLRECVREVGLRPMIAVVPTLFFALPAPGTAARLVEANGGNVEPFLYALLMWALRHRPLVCGMVFGLGFLHREFTLYAFVALAAIEVLGRRPGLIKRVGLTLVSAAVVWGLVQWIKRYSSGAGPGTTVADVHQASDNITELTNRMCVDPTTAATGFYKLATDHWPVLFGTLSEPVRDFGVVTTVSQGLPWSAGLLVALVALAAVGILIGRRVRGFEFCAFLVLTALFSITGYVVGRCGTIDFYYMRYELLSLAGASGLGAWLLATAAPRPLKRAWVAMALIWFAVIAMPHARLWHEYLRHPPDDVRRALIAELDARGVRYASSRYWVSYALTFLTDERIVVKSSDFIRIQEYQRVVDAHANEMMRIEREPCAGGEEIMPRVYLCR